MEPAAPGPGGMRRQDEIGWIRRFLAHQREGSAQLAAEVLRVPAAHYTSADHLAQERQALFRRRPGVVGLSADVPECGDYLARDLGGVPVLVVRGGDGRVRAFVNACRHRGSPLAEGRGRAEGGLLHCPFHAWSYTSEGRLHAIPLAEAAFAELADAERHLLSRPCTESHGLVLARAEGDAPIDAEALLGGLTPDLEVLRLDAHEHFDTHVAEWACNWKLLLETFLESYHVFSLHRESVHPWYLSHPMLYDGFGPNLRFPVPKRSLLKLAEMPERQWSLADHATLQWLIAPNALLTSTRVSSLLWRFEPLQADRTRVTTSLYAKRSEGEGEGEELRPGPLAKEFALHLRVTSEEDFSQQMSVQASLASGALPNIVVGRHEGALIHFHRALAELIASAGPS